MDCTHSKDVTLNKSIDNRLNPIMSFRDILTFLFMIYLLLRYLVFQPS